MNGGGDNEMNKGSKTLGLYRWSGIFKKRT